MFFEFLFVAAASYLLGAIGTATYTSNLVPSNKPRLQSLCKTFTDVFKGYLIVMLAQQINLIAAEIAMLFVFIGHVYPPHRGFSGGNGMSTLFGAITGFNPLLALVALGAWGFTYFVYRYKALAAVLAAVITPLIVFVVGLNLNLISALIISSIIMWRQRKGLMRLMDGTEKMVSWD